MRGGGYVVRALSTSDVWTLDRPEYEVTVDRSPRGTVDATGATRESLPGRSFADCVLVLEWNDDRWHVLGVNTKDCLQ